MAIGRVCLLAFAAGAGAVHLLPAPPSAVLCVCTSMVSLCVVLWRGRRKRHGLSCGHPVFAFLLWLAVAAAAGLAYGSAWVSHRLGDALDPSNEDKVTRVVLRVAELPRLDPESRVFVAEVLSSIPEGVPSRIQVRWNAGVYAGPYGKRSGRPEAADFPVLVPGQVWRMALILRNPHGARNPHGFDYEGHVFAQGIRATGTVRGTPVQLGDDGWASLPVAAQRARHYVREAMLPYIGDLRWGGVLLALAIGDQASVGPSDWLTFNRSGLTHLVSISGSHVTMIAVLAGVAVNFLWRRLHWRGRALAERLPAQLASAWSALLVAWLYCLLAGWGVPARRTFIMLAVMALSLALRLPLSPTHVLALAAFVVVALDPWSPLAAGFWLSFLAVYVLMASTGWWGRVAFSPSGFVSGSMSKFHAAARLQLFVTLALMPPLARLFNEVSIVSPLANAYAIPLIGMLITPLALLFAGLAMLPGMEVAAAAAAWLAHALLQLCMLPTEWLASLPGASLPVATVPWWATMFAMAGVGVALLPRGFPFRTMGWAFMLPVLVWTPSRPAPGDWELYALDVGQGSALVLRTAGQVMVYDTGVRYSPDADAAQRSLLPFLRAKGIRKIDVLVVSHGDLDHVGGLRSVLEALPVEQAYAPFDLSAWLAREGRLLGGRDGPPPPRAESPCMHGLAWRADEIGFEFLWPLGAGSVDIDAGTRERNSQSCVLRIKGAHHSILLPGDIGVDEENALAARGLGVTDVVLAAHHGSRYSSGPSLVAATQAWHAIAQAGRWNRYGHPASIVRRRWQAHGADFWDTGRDGAVLARSRQGVLTVEAERERRPRYWSAPVHDG